MIQHIRLHPQALLLVIQVRIKEQRGDKKKMGEKDVLTHPDEEEIKYIPHASYKVSTGRDSITSDS